MSRCMHFLNYWDDDANCNMDEVYSDERVNTLPNVEHPHKKIEPIKDVLNEHWKAILNFGRWITVYESCITC